MNKYKSIASHFSLVSPIKPNTLICNDIFPIKVWKLTKQPNEATYMFTKQIQFETLELFEEKMGPIQYWKPITFTTKPELQKFYQDSAKHVTDDWFYIVIPTETYKTCKAKKPEVYENYFIKQDYSQLKTKLPELEGIF